MERVRFSFLIPSRNRLELLKHAIASIVAQGFASCEIVVADNCSSEDYAGYLEQISNKVPIRYLRSDAPISVTDNWNAALDASRGDYIVMLGDDDALAPDYCRTISAAIEKFGEPQVIYCMAFHYAYPGVMESKPDGYLAAVNNSPLFRGKAAYRLSPARAQTLGKMAMRFRHWFSFNAQHYVWKREFVFEVRRKGHRLFESPYPDYYASIVTFMRASSIVVVPRPAIIIGISKKSFGFSLFNEMEEAGQREFFHNEERPNWFADLEEGLKQALQRPGSMHYRNWLLAVIWARQSLRDRPAMRIDADRYDKIQSVNGKVAVGHDVSCADQVYYPAGVQEFGLRNHRNIMDAFDYLRRRQNPLSRLGQALKRLMR